MDVRINPTAAPRKMRNLIVNSMTCPLRAKRDKLILVPLRTTALANNRSLKRSNGRTGGDRLVVYSHHVMARRIDRNGMDVSFIIPFSARPGYARRTSCHGSAGSV